MKQKAFKFLAVAIFVVFSAWWLYVTYGLHSADHNSVHNQLFGATYGVMSLAGGIVGLVAARRWGGHKSLLGRALLFFALGLLAQEFGQLAYSFYTYVLKVDIPYPSVGDVGYFGSVILYIYAATQLAKAAGVGVSVKQAFKKLVAVLLPLILLVASYAYFLRDYQFDFSSLHSTVAVALDFGYPLGQALYIAIALLTYLLCKNLLGGLLKNKVLLLLLALVVQYVADFSFLHAARAGTAYPAGANDYVYLVAYLVMALALNSFRIETLPTAPKPQPEEA